MHQAGIPGESIESTLDSLYYSRKDVCSVKGKQNNKQDAYNTNLLVSLLMRFPEIMAINFDMPRDRCKFVFLLQGKAGKKEYEEMTLRLQEALDALREMTGESLEARARLFSAKNISIIEVTCGTTDLSLEAINLITAIIDDSFPGMILKDLETINNIGEDELLRQEEIIGYLLSHTTSSKKENLFAYREAGKVFVFDK